MEEIDLTELFKYYVRRIPLIVLAILISLLFSYFYVEYMQVPMYDATTTIILVENSKEESDAVTQSSITINEKLVTTYSEIIKSRRVLEQVIKEIDLNMTPNSLANRIAVTSVTDTPIIEITVYDDSNEEAVVIANKVAEVFQKEIMEIYKLENISVIDEAIQDEYAIPYNINNPKTIFLFLVAGIAISCIIIFIMYYFDDTIKSRKEVEARLDLAILGEVPLVERLNKKSKKKKNRNKKNNYKITHSERYENQFENIDKKQETVTIEPLKDSELKKKEKEIKEGSDADERINHQ